VPLLRPQKAPPVASTRDYSATHHGDTRTDPWFWLHDPDYPKVEDQDILGYLEAENDYFRAVMDPLADQVDTVFEEIKGRLKDDDSSVPWREGRYEYRWAYSAGADYRQWFRRPAKADGAEAADGGDWTLILDEPALADGKPFFKLAGFAVSPCGRYLAYSMDMSGSERFQLFVRDLETGEDQGLGLAETSGEIVWGADSDVLYTVLVTEEWRPAHVVSIPRTGGDMRTLYSETDTGYFVHISESADERYVLIRTADHVTSEYLTLEKDRGMDAVPMLWRAREDGHDYSLDHDGAGWLVLSNRDEKNFSLYRAAGPGDWTVILSGSDDLYIQGFSAHADFLAVAARDAGLDQIMILAQGVWSTLGFDEAAYTASLGHNPEYRQSHLRIGFSSMITPSQVIDINVATGSRTVRKEQEIPSGYVRDDYVAERLMITARDGAEVPVSIVYKTDWSKGGKLHLYGYGAYGLGMDPGFSPARLSLLDRGFAYAIAHIRGGDEKGRHWYEAGKLTQRTNTFNDFVDVARALIDQGYAAKTRITISGGSAGGELMGAVINQAKDLFGAAVMHVPFVDVLNTMLDADLPLTPMEWPEWGNPIDSADDYQMIKSYCPYTNLAAGDYPPIMVTGGLNDPRVTYWEPAKYTAKLRTLKRDDTPLIMKINMEAGHGGKSGRYDRYREVAEEYVFVTAALEG